MEKPTNLEEVELLDWAHSAEYGESKEFGGKTYTVRRAGPFVSADEVAREMLAKFADAIKATGGVQ